MTPVDQPALDDDVTARLFELSVQQVRNGAYLPLFAPVAFGIAAWQADAPVIAVPMCLLGVVMVWHAFTRSVPGVSRWPAAARLMLEEQPWRETPATVLDTRGTVLVLPGDQHVRVHGLPKQAREVAVRAGRVWLVGPDNAGWYVVRVDGFHTPLPARLVAVRHAAPARPTDELVVTAWARHLVSRARGDLWFALGCVVGFTVLTVLVGIWWIVAAAVAAGAGWVAYQVRQLRRATRLRDAGPWRRADATVSWTNRYNGVGDGTIALRFADGHRYTAHLDGVPLDVFATAWREEALWVAPGGIVGFPEYPVVAFARLTPES